MVMYGPKHIGSHTIKHDVFDENCFIILALTIAKDDFYKCIQKLYDRANLCVQLEGMYVENYTIKV